MTASTARAARLAEAWREASSRRLRVAESFVSIQGEGTRAGLPTAFLRLTGCALRCRWCDTQWAFHDGSWRELAGLASELASLGVGHVCITGGEPLLQPSVVPLARHLVDDLALDVAVETGGDQDISVLPRGVSRIVDVKLPGSGMESRMLWSNFEILEPGDEVKMVVADRADYEAARGHVARLRRSFSGPILLSPVAGALPPAELAAWILKDRLPVRMQLQLHKAIWPEATKGV